MITFKEFILERRGDEPEDDMPGRVIPQDSDDEDDEILSLMELVQENCGPYLKQMQKGKLLFRGVGSLGTKPKEQVTIGDHTIGYFEKVVRRDRNPESTPGHIHDAIDDWFMKKHRVTPRSSAMFCYGESMKQSATQYGRMCVVFPVGDFKCVWSPEVTDLYKMLESQDALESDEAAIAVMNSLNYKVGDLKGAMKSDSEIMLTCYSYFAIPVRTAAQIEMVRKALT